MTPVTLTKDQASAMEITRVGLMTSCPFYAYYFYAEMKEVFTRDIPTAATDGRHIFINPDYVCALKPQERVFVYAHEIDHVISRHPQRIEAYMHDGTLRGKPADRQHFNVVTDYVINAGLMEQGVGSYNPEWLYHKDVTGEDLAEDIYETFWKDKPKGTFGSAGMTGKGAKPDAVGGASGPGGGGFDTLLPPPVDPVTGAVDAPDEGTFKEAIARAAGAAKAMGKMPASLARRVETILEPQVNWRDHIRLLVTGHIGSRRETWNRPNRRRLSLNPIVIMPGRAGHGADLVVVGVDTSGSVGPAELAAYMGEVSGILSDVKPKRVMLIACDAAVQQVDEAATLDELELVRGKGFKGGGGTSFVPVFEHIAAHGLKPDALIYLTDMMGRFPAEAPNYPVVWAATTDQVGPFGETVRLKV